MTRLVLASASPARRRLLESAGVHADVVVSGVDEAALLAELGPAVRDDPDEHCLALARAKAEDVAARIAEAPAAADVVVVGCDSVLDIAGVAYGKPASPDDATHRWRHLMAGRSGVLRTGHWLVRLGPSTSSAGAVAATTVRFGTPDDDELTAYVESGEPLRVAGAFTLDGLSAPFVEGVDGDPSNVIGLSLPLLRKLLRELGVRWTDLVR